MRLSTCLFRIVVVPLTCIASVAADASPSDDKLYALFRAGNLAELERAARSDNILAQRLTGDLLREHKRHASAVDWYERAAASGDIRVASRIASAYERGLGRQADPATALKWRRRAAETGDFYDQLALARLLTTENGIPRNDEEAIKWYARAAEHWVDQGESGMYVIKAAQYASGRDVPRDFRKAYMYAAASDRATDLSDTRLHDLNRGLQESVGRQLDAKDIEQAELLATKLVPVDRTEFAASKLLKLYMIVVGILFVISLWGVLAVRAIIRRLQA